MDENETCQVEGERQPQGIAEHLEELARIILSISEKEQDEEKKLEYFQYIFNVLEQDALELQSIIEELNEELPEQVQEACLEVDKNMARSSNFFLEAINYMVEFMETEKVKFIEKARESIQMGSESLDKAEQINQQLGEIPMEESYEA